MGSGSALTNSSTGVITTGVGQRATLINSNAGGTITNAYGFQVANLSNTGTITNTYGVYVNDLTAGTQTNTPYSFYASDAGTYNYFAGNVGIGTTTPVAKLDIAGTLGSQQALFNVSSTTATNVVSSLLSVGASGAFNLSSNLGTGVGGNYLCIDTSTYEVLRGNGSVCTTSSERFKENINSLDYGLNEVLSLRPVTFNYKAETNMGNGLQLGFIAEEVRNIIPEVVTLDKTGQPFGLNYPVLTAVLTKAIQELNLNLQSIVSTTTSSTTESQLFANTFWDTMFSRMTEWFASATNSIGDFFANRVRTKELCIS